MGKPLELETLLEKVMEELEKKLGKAGTTMLKDQTIEAVSNFSNLEISIESMEEKMVESTVETHMLIPSPKWQEGLNELASSTPARIGVWRAGTRPMTKTMLQIRQDHAAAVDAVYGEVSEDVLREFGLFSVETLFDNTENYLKRPDMGRIITDEGVKTIREKCKPNPQVQIIVSDGLSANAIDANLR